MALYLRVHWHHDFADEPVLLLSEIIGGDEVRKVEIYADGRSDFADENRSTGTTQLSQLPMPTVDEIAAQDEFEPAVIDRATFEEAWQEALDQHGERP